LRFRLRSRLRYRSRSRLRFRLRTRVKNDGRYDHSYDERYGEGSDERGDAARRETERISADYADDADVGSGKAEVRSGGGNEQRWAMNEVRSGGVEAETGDVTEVAVGREHGEVVFERERGQILVHTMVRRAPRAVGRRARAKLCGCVAG
jgi:hypothetical protein